jgi:putative IMPACT (imprinted ancient) family translation regulator
LLQKELKNVLVVVVRYFGGIKLGAGGLVRAYTRTAAEAVNEAGIVKMTYSSRGILSIDYGLLGSVEYFLRQNGIPIQEMNYGEKVSMQIITSLDWEGLTKKLMDICSGNIEIERLDSVYYNWERI